MSEGKERSRFGAFLGGALLGGAVGTLVGMLLAPRSGTETRHQLGEGMADMREKSAKLMEDVRGTAGTRLQGVKERLGRRISLISEAIDAGRRAANDVRVEADPSAGESRAE